MVKLLQGDCLELLKGLEQQSIDMVFCDLPYGTTQNKWDTVLPLSVLWALYKSVLKPGGVVVLTAAQPFTSLLVSSNLTWFKYDWVWQKPKGTGHLNAKKQPLRDKEDVLVFYGKQCTYNPQFTPGTPYKDKAGKNHRGVSSRTSSYGAYTNYRENNTGFRYPKQVQQFPVVERNTLHPTQKPVELVEYFIKTYTNEGNTVLDNCMGSGTTGVACVNTGRDFIGMELDKSYFSMAKDRINKALQNKTQLCQIYSLSK